MRNSSKPRSVPRNAHNFACYAVASHSKLLTLLHHKVAMDYLGRHKRTAHTNRNLCPK